MGAHDPGFAFALALGSGVLAQLVARHLRVPNIVLLLGVGVALGPDGLGWIDPRTLGDGLFALVSLAVAVILFEGGLGLDLARIRASGPPIRRLVTWGALVTTLGAAIAARALLDWPVSQALLFGTLVIVTGPTVIKPLLRAVPLRPRLSTLLEAEGLLIDPVGAIVAAVTLQVIVSPTLDTLASGALGLFTRLAFGAGAGVALGFALAALLRGPRLVPAGLENLVALGGSLAGFALCEAVVTESGILAVTVAGAVVGSRAGEIRDKLSEFQEPLTTGLIGVLFVLLAADVRFADVRELGVPGLLTVAALLAVVRPLGVFWCTAGSGFSVRERLFAAWLGPRGVVAAAVASLAAAVLDEIGAPGGREVRALVFLTIAISVVLLGGGAPFVARLLQVRAPSRDGVAILGAEELGLRLGALLRATTGRVVFVDNNPHHCRAAEEQGFPVVFGDALEARTLARIPLERMRSAIALTSNPDLNQLFASEARAEYGVQAVYLAVGRRGGEASSRLAERLAAHILFDRPKDIERWNVRLRHRACEERSLRFAAPADGALRDVRAAEGADAYLVLAVARGEHWTPMHTDYAPLPGDRGIALVHATEREAAESGLRALGWEPEPAGDAATETATEANVG